MDFECFMDEQVVIKETTIIKEEVEIDQNYNPESENAQSGKAVAEAVETKLDKMTNKVSQIASGNMVPKFYAVDKTDGVVTDTLLKGSFEADGNTVAIRNSNGQLIGHNFEFDDEGNRIATYTGILINKPYLESRLKKEADNIKKSVVPIQENETPIIKIYAQDGYTYNDSGVITILTDINRYNDLVESDSQANADSIPIRNPRGNLYTGIPTETMEAANKKYVDDSIANIEIPENIVDQNYNPKSENAQSGKAVAQATYECIRAQVNDGPVPQVYVQNRTIPEAPDGYEADLVSMISTDWSFNNEMIEEDPEMNANCIPIRNSKGNLYSSTPVEPMEVTTKKYVDDSIANIEISGGIGAIDQEYKPESENAQSGKAVAGALNKYIPIRENWAPLDTAYIQKSNSDSSEGVSILYIENKSWREEYPTDMSEFIATRNERSNLISNTPEIDLEVANKKYVDDAIANIDISGKLDKMTDKTSNTASGKMIPKFYAVDKVNDVVSDTLLRGSWSADGNTIPLRNGNGQIMANTSKDDSSALVNINYLKDYVAGQIPPLNKLNHIWKNANETVTITRSNMYFCCSSSNSGDVQVMGPDDEGNIVAVTDSEGDSISVGKVFILFVPENTTSYNSVKGYMCFYISAKQGSGILSPQIDGSAGNIFIKKEDMEAGNHFIKTGGGMNVWTLPFDI